jgi:multidrug efflux pump subunit AcrB
VVVFLPLVAVSGVTGSFFRALAITMTARCSPRWCWR